MRVIVIVALLLMALGGCKPDVKTQSPTAVVVSVNSDVSEVTRLRTTVLDADVMKSAGTGTYNVTSGDFPFSFTVAPALGATKGRFVVRVEGLDADERVVVSVQAGATFSPGKTRLMTLWLSLLCRSVECSEKQTCHYEEGDRRAGQCGDLLYPKLTDFEPGADEDPSQFVVQAAPVTVPDDAGPGNAGGDGSVTTDASTLLDAGVTTDAGTVDGGADGSVPPAPNVPTVGSFRSLGAHRYNSDKSRALYDDGFEESGRVCNAAGMCAVAGFTP